MVEQMQSAQAVSRPRPRRPVREVTVWLDYTSGHGVDDDGRSIGPILGGHRTKPRLIDLLETARHHHARRLMMCGQLPASPKDWLLPDAARAGTAWTPGWENEGHYLEAPGQGRFLHVETKARLSVNTVVEWFPTGGQQMAPADARAAWNTLEHVVARGAGHSDWALLRLPASTGLNLWLDSVPDSYDLAPCAPDVGAEIQGSEPQHRIESYLDSSRCRCDDSVALMTSKAPLDGFAYADGRFMYDGAPPKELGGGPGVRMHAQDATALWSTVNAKGQRPGQFARPATWCGPGSRISGTTSACCRPGGTEAAGTGEPARHDRRNVGSCCGTSAAGGVGLGIRHRRGREVHPVLAAARVPDRNQVRTDEFRCGGSGTSTHHLAVPPPPADHARSN